MSGLRRIRIDWRRNLIRFEIETKNYGILVLSIFLFVLSIDALFLRPNATIVLRISL